MTKKESAKHPKHDELYFSLLCDKMWNPKPTKEQLKVLSDFVIENLAHPKNCPTCGGIPVDIRFKDGEKDYFFTCWKVTENDKVIAKTDYQKLCLYALLQKKERLNSGAG